MKIIPQPKKIEKISGSFSIEQGDTIYCDQQFKKQAFRFVEMVKACSGISLDFIEEIDVAVMIKLYPRVTLLCFRRALPLSNA